MADLKKMSDSDLAEWISGWKPSTKEYILGMAELDRRKNLGNTIRGWIRSGSPLSRYWCPLLRSSINMLPNPTYMDSSRDATGTPR